MLYTNAIALAFNTCLRDVSLPYLSDNVSVFAAYGQCSVQLVTSAVSNAEFLYRCLGIRKYYYGQLIQGHCGLFCGIVLAFAKERY
jgi:hypothetical protein